MLDKIRDWHARANAWLENIYGPIEEPNPLPDSKVYGFVRELLLKRAAQYDKMTDDFQQFPVDSNAYNIVAHELRAVRWALDEMVKHG